MRAQSPRAKQRRLTGGIIGGEGLEGGLGCDGEDVVVVRLALRVHRSKLRRYLKPLVASRRLLHRILTLRRASSLSV